MARRHKNYENLKKDMLNTIDLSMHSFVREYMADVQSEAVEEVVYNKYNPKIYKRRGANNGGLASTDNMMMTNIKSGKKTIYNLENITRGSGQKGYLTPLIVKGNAWAKKVGHSPYHPKELSYAQMAIRNKGDFTPYYKPRDFISRTRYNIDRNEIVEHLKMGIFYHS